MKDLSMLFLTEALERSGHDKPKQCSFVSTRVCGSGRIRKIFPDSDSPSIKFDKNIYDFYGCFYFLQAFRDPDQLKWKVQFGSTKKNLVCWWRLFYNLQGQFAKTFQNLNLPSVRGIQFRYHGTYYIENNLKSASRVKMYPQFRLSFLAFYSNQMFYIWILKHLY